MAAWLMKGVDAGGALTGSASAFIFYATHGWRLFALLFFVFVVTVAATKIASLKNSKTAAPRRADQVMANLFVPTVALVLDPPFPVFAFIGYVVVLAALAELAADTVSSELGEAFGATTYSITLSGRVPSGSNGGISAVGTAAGILAAVSVVAVGASLFFPEIPMQWSISATVAGVLGMLIDSFLGALFENRGWLNNNAVNLLGTLSAAVTAYLLFDWGTVRI